MPEIESYHLCGLKVTSVLPLFNLEPWAGVEDAPGLSVTLGPAAELDGAKQIGPLVQVGPDGACRFTMPEVADYLVNPDGTNVEIHPFLSVDLPDISAFLYSTVFAIVCYRRGWLPLHAASVKIGDKAVAFSGVSGAGKSTLASRFAAKGIPVLSDDVSVLDVSDPAHVALRPSLPHIKLWSDVMEKTDISSDGLIPVRNRINKFYMPLEKRISERMPLTSVYFLEVAQEARDEEISPMVGVDAFLRLSQGIFRRHIGRCLLTEQGVFLRLAPAMASVQAFHLRRRLTIERADEIVDEIIAREGAS